MISSKKQLWTIEDLAKHLQVKPSVIAYWVRNTDLPYIKLNNKHIRFMYDDVKEWIENQKVNYKFIKRDLGRVE